MGRLKPRVVAVVGPTASGKSALAIELALRFSGEVVSCDSMQLYSGMDIGTAKPTSDEMRGVAHHMISIASPDEKYSAARYAAEASAAVEDILSRGKLPIFCGGTGMYLDGILRPGGFAEFEGDEKLRAELASKAPEELYEMLVRLDPEAAAATHVNNVRRVIRALELTISTGIPKSELDRRSREGESPYDCTILGLKPQNREYLYGRIDRRVDEMLRDGLVEEARRLDLSTDSTAGGAIGYKELAPYLAGQCSLEAAAAQIKLATRHYAKRQLTWFNRDERINWIYIDKYEKSEDNFKYIVNNACALLTNS